MGTGFKAGVSGTPLLPNLTVQCEKGCTVTVSREGVTKSKTATDHNSGVTFSGLSFGTWDITVTDGTDTKQDTVELKRDTEKAVSLAKIYGIKRNIFSMDPAWERECDAVGMKAACSVGDNAGTNDFDKCYPWSGMNKIGYTQGLGFWDDGMFLDIPAFFYRRFFDGVYEHIQIADKKAPGFSVHPAFLRASEGRYYSGLALKRSLATAGGVPGTAPLANLTREAARAKLGNGEYLLDADVLSAIQMLYLVEFATYDSQKAIGRGIVDKGSFSATNVEIDPPKGIPFLTGVYSGHVYYRNIEDLWGNLYTWVDGLTYYNGVYKVCHDPKKYAQYGNAEYKRLGYDVKPGLNNSYITHLGMDDGDMPHIMLPTGVCSGSADAFCCDACTTTADWGVPAVGGCAISKDAAGLFGMNFFADNTKSPQIGYRWYRYSEISQEVEH